MAELSQRLANLSPEKRRLLEQRLQKKPDVAEPIAIVGMACRLPGAPNLDAYWRLLLEGRNATREIPPDRWDIDEFYDPRPDIPGKINTRWGGFVDHVGEFDPLFFGITPREAGKMDPQQRLLLEVAWEAMENGCLAPERMAGSNTGVYIGIGGTDYSKLPAHLDNYFEHIDAYGGTGNALSIAANRLSYILDLRGPSLAVDTACSSALVAIHLAVVSLRSRESDAAIAGGVNLILSPETTIAFSNAHMLSPDGQCRPFDASANGYVRGEGCGIVVLKRLTDAIQARDRVLAVIRGTAVNQDGRTSGITAPNSVSQQAAIRSALQSAGLSPDQVSYLEAHGTGTPLGDPIEVQALAKTFRKTAAAAPPCYLGSVKGNIGHLETAAGIAGLIKVVLMMQHRQILPQAYFESLNPNINLSGSRLVIPRGPLPWEPQGPRIAGVSSYGFGGTNTHVVLEEASPAEAGPCPADRPMDVLALSAKTQSALKSLAGAYADWLDANPDTTVAEIGFSAGAGRSHFNHRLAVVTADRDGLRRQLAAYRDGETAENAIYGQVKVVPRAKLAFLFTGQGSQYVGMGRALYETQPVFRDAIDECDAVLRSLLERPLLSVLYPKSGADATLDETAYTQPALFAVEYALASLWRSWGVEPDVVLGHSVGEYVAACVAGVFGMEDGLRLIAHRARLMQELPHNGLMAVVFAGSQRVAEAIEPFPDRVSIAAANGPENTVISGDAETVRALAARFEAAGIGTKQLTVSHAFHSPLMEPMLDEFERLAAEISYGPPRVPLVSNVTGELLSGPPDAAYWRRHVRNAVQFADGMQTVAEQQVHAILELGPTTSLLGMGRRILPELRTLWLPSLRKGQDDWRVLLGTLSKLYVLGAKIDWQGFDRPWTRRRLSLPNYPFERKRYWFDDHSKGSRRAFAGGRGPSVHPLLGSPIPSAVEKTLFETRLGNRSPKYLVDHQVQGSPVMPAAAYVEQGMAVAEQVFGPGKHGVENVAIQQAMFLPDGAGRVVQITVSPELGGESTFEVYSAPADSPDAKIRWSMHACGKIRHAPADVGSGEPVRIDLAEVRGRATDRRSREEFYEQIAARGLAYGPAFQVLGDLCRSDRDALAQVELAPEVAKEVRQYHLHPALLDACFQSMAGVVPREPDGSDSPSTYMPVHVRAVRVHAELTEGMWTYAVRSSADNRPSPETVEGNVYLLDDDGRVLVELEGVRVQRVGRAQGQDRRGEIQSWFYEVQWQPQAPPEAAAAATLGDWLILADRGGAGDRLAESLRAQGLRCVIVRPDGPFAAGENGSAVPRDEFHVDPLDGEDYRRLLQAAFAAGRTCAGVVHLWSLDLEMPRDGGETSLAEARRLGCGSVLRLIQQLARSKFAKPPALWLVTRGAQAVGEGQTPLVVQSPLWGMGRVAALEHPEMRCRLVDLDPAGFVADEAARLLRELVSQSEEPQVAYRGRERLVARLAPAASTAAGDRKDSSAGRPPREVAFRLRTGTSGSFDSLWFEANPRRSPGPGQVEIEVRAAGLNFSDVLKAMGLYPGITDEVVPLGIECSGVVTAVGEGATRFLVGDAVMGVAPYSFASHAITAEYALVPKPDSLTDEEACTIPITFLTAYYALVRLAGMQPGERLLIHAGAGGVGLAAIQIAQQIGAEIFATAGSDAKREFLRSLGVPHVMNSRTLDFAEEILAATDRRGVDIVLNSLPGDAIPKSLSVLAAYGRFLEIGKTDIYQNRMIGLLPFQDNLTYSAIDLDRMLRQRPEYIRDLFAELMTHFGSGDYKPLPMTVFPIDDVVGAFRYMAQRKNIGKVVVSLERSCQSVEAESPPAMVREDGTYLVTGGLGALGLRVGEWLALQGAKHVVLMGRREPSDEAAAAIDSLHEQGVRAVVVQGDVVSRDSLEAALAQIPGDFPPLRGVVHAAGVLADGVMFDMDLARLDKALAPKVQGAWNLHAATLDAPLDFFVLFSSIAGVLGSPGQANYAAGNAFLDALAYYRRSQGLPAVSIQWGPWADSGMAAHADRSDQIAARGMDLIPPEKGLEVLARLIESKPVSMAVIDAHWPALIKQVRGRTPPLLERVAGDEVAAAAGQEDKVDHAFRKELSDLGARQRIERLRDYFARELARIMQVDPSGIDVNQPLNMLGLDSLMVIELKNNLEQRLDLTLPMARFLEGPSVTGLAEAAAEAFAGGQPPANGKAGGAEAASSARAAASDWTPLVLLQRGGDMPPLFCVHPIGGDIRCYVDLARSLSGDRPVYALRGRGIEGTLDPHGSVDELAGDFLGSIREIQPRGPYYLAGWSTGGIYAYEMARRLHARGELGGLVFLDTPTPAIFKHVDLDDEARFLYDLVNFSNYFAGTSMQVSYEELRSQKAEDRLAIALEEAKRHGMMRADVSTDYVHRLVEASRANVRALMNYTPPPLDHPIWFFRPTVTTVLEEASGQELEGDLGWGQIPGLTLLVETVPGDHFTMMTGENSRFLADQLIAKLEGKGEPTFQGSK
ncbi:MAG: SDR family NAD(P)-dependent oxidoreductase [Pirellulales bacterium]|nr:SDR family NAD(P)-dependent oxidoreductase [Pirellulales bacterium]